MKLNKRTFQELKSAFLHIPLVSTALLVAALGSCWYAAHNAQTFAKVWHSQTAVKKETPAGLIKLVKRPVSDQEIQTLVDVLRTNHPSVSVAQGPTPGSLVISATDRGAYREWMSALGTVQGASRAGSVWLATSLCLGECGDAALSADVQGVVQTTEKGG
jgi:hypothetical protein